MTRLPPLGSLAALAGAPAAPRAVVAPDSFKGTLAAPEVAVAIARGLERAGVVPDCCPVADGGEGTTEILLAACGGEARRATVHDPLGRSVTACFGLLAPDGQRAALDMAAASGLHLVTSRERHPWLASTYGVGELICAAIAAGARQVLIAAGGSATVDGGAGAIRAIRDAGGLRGAELSVLCDVRTPWEQCAEIYGPQKGADALMVRRLADRLEALAGQLPSDPRGLEMSGAAGGLAGGLWSAFGAELVPGAAFVLDAVGFDQRVELADCVVVGEGRIDAQSTLGKIVGEIGRRARAAHVPLMAVVGRRELSLDSARALGIDTIIEAGDTRTIEAAGERIGNELLRRRARKPDLAAPDR
ncbi:MAG TPA: glycerate kinase [Solirubrobacteraceae bacterium]|nr:glycerate kinase [Solirubrobacteraceae bacterium]